MLSFKKLPVFKLSKIKNNNSYFDLSLKIEDGLVKQSLNSKLKSFLTRRYIFQESNTDPMHKSAFRRKQGEKFVNNLKKNYKKSFKDKNVLEIGCGSGYILTKLKNKGANVIGIEPSKIYEKGNVTVYKNIESLPKNIKFDLILTNAVMEHIFDLKIFLKKLKKISKKNCEYFNCVPDCEEALNFGDPTMLNHEHIYYFTKTSIRNFFNSQGFNSHSFHDKNGNLYCHIKNTKIKKKNLINENANTVLQNYKKKYFNNLNNLKILLDKFPNSDFFFYGATAAITNLSKEIKNNKLKKIFVLDSDKNKYGKFISGINQKIKNPEYLSNFDSENNIFVIFSYYYSKEITQNLIKKFKQKKTNIFDLVNVK